MARKLIVEVVGDSSSLERSLGRAGTASQGFGGKLAGLAKTALLVGGAAGVGAVAVGLEKSVKAALDAQQSTARLDQAFKVVGLSATQSAGAIDTAEAASRKLGFTDDQTRTALGSLVTATGNVHKSMLDLSVAQDLARFKGVDLTDATKMLTMAMTGSQRAAKQLGIVVSPVSTAVDQLKASHENLTTAVGKADLAQAKLTDKMSTGQAVIDAVTAKVHGQADAYSQTAAGGMAKFRAEMEHLQVTIGNLVLPALTRWVTKLSEGVGWVQKFVDKATTMNSKFGDVAQSGANAGTSMAHTGATMDSATAASIKLAEALRVLGNLWGGLKSVLSGVVSAVQAVRGALQSLNETSKMIAQTYMGWAQQVGTALKNVGMSIKNAVTEAYNGAVHIGQEIVSGILNGVGGLFGSLKSHLEGTLKSVLSNLNPFSPVSHGGEVYIGRPLAEGAIQGWILGSAALPGKMSQTLQDAITTARAVIVSARSSFEAAFGGLMSIADSALAAVQGKVQTASEKALAKLVAAHDAAAAAVQLAAAQDALVQAQAGGDPAAILAAQQTLDDLLYQAHVAALQKKAEAERLNLDARQAVQKLHFDAALAALQDSLAKHGATAAEATKAILKLLASFGVNFKAVGQDMGVAWIEGLKEALSKAAKGAGKLSGTIGDAADSIKVPTRGLQGFASGGIVGGPLGAPQLAVVHGGETVIPAGANGGVFVIHNHTYLDGREIMVNTQKHAVADLRNGGFGVPGAVPA